MTTCPKINTFIYTEILVSWMMIPNIWKNKKCSKPPTSIYIGYMNLYDTRHGIGITV